MPNQRSQGRAVLLGLLAVAGCDERALVGKMQMKGGGTFEGQPDAGAMTGAGGAGAGGAIAGSGGISGTGGAAPNASCAPISTAVSQMNLCGRTNGIAYAPDGTLLATATQNDPPNVHLWSLPDGAHVRDLDGISGGAYAVAFSPDGRTLAVGGMSRDGRSSVDVAKLYDVGSGAQLLSLPTTSGFYVDSVAFSNDGAMLATGGYMGPVEVWRASDGAILTRVPYPTSVHNVHFVPTGSQLVVGGVDERATVWTIPDGTLVMTLNGIASEMADAAFSPDGQRIASTGGNSIKVWDSAGTFL